ncbi:efflux RND transporter permease subunit [uncultured Thiohalocapsa sp.]|uniref:efflux RND transporter permease subunit n=1 Tax=uncultured Thiohalocapsa sp. TaxID=768990 RepID=UPI0025CC04DB|nr:efflux RND transporter permease subunit [uncultured Thiohalocapsa sp.]
MMIGHFFIDRPRFAIVIAVITVLCGLIAMRFLPVSEYPDVTPPTVVVTTSWPGAAAETVLESVVAPLEDAINGAEGMLYMSSSSFNDGSANITVTFRIGTDPKLAAVDVQNRVYGAMAQLPEAVQRQGVSVDRKSTDILCVISLYSPNNAYDTVFINNYADIHLLDALRRIPGVGAMALFGDKTYAMRVWLDPERLAAYALTSADVAAAIEAENMQVAAGRIGAEPAPAGQQLTYGVQLRGRLATPEEFGGILVKTLPDGSAVRVRDVARVELGARNYDSTGLLDGEYPAALMIVNQRPGANALEVVDAIKTALDAQREHFPPDLQATLYYDTTVYVRASIAEVAETLAIAVVLVIGVVFLFLQNARSTFVPAVTIPIALIGTFAFLLVMGYSINVITLLALILAIGIVVDDGILEIENDNRLMQDEGLSPHEAAWKTVSQTTGPVIATTLVLLAVFVPIAFFPGLSGELYRQFALTIAAAVSLSALNALSLSPALCSHVLRPPSGRVAASFRWFNAGFGWLGERYARAVGGVVRRVPVMLLLFAVVGVATVALYLRVPTGFIPPEDTGKFMINIQLPPGAALERTTAVSDRVAAILEDTPGVEHFMTMAGYNGLSQSYSPASAFMIVVLAPWEERGSRETMLFSIIQRLSRRFADEVPEAQVMPFMPPAIPGMGMSGGFELVIRSPGGGSPVALGEVVERFIAAAEERPEVAHLFTTFQTGVPSLYVTVDRHRAETMGVPLAHVFTTLQDALGSRYVDDFNRFGKVYQVILQADGAARARIDDIARLQVQNRDGDMVPLSTLVQIERRSGPNEISRYNMIQAVTLHGMSGLGYASGETMAALTAVAAETLPPGYDFTWTGLSYQEVAAGNTVLYIFAVSLVFIYLFLVAQYESWTLAFAVLMAVPVAVLGALIAVALVNLLLPVINNNIYAQIGIVLLFGLATKIAILIVEFAKQSREAGMEIIASAVHAGRLRFRPVLMQAAAFLLGTLPLVIASGPGGMARRSIGLAIFGGILLSVLVGLLLMPAAYVLMQRLAEALGAAKTRRRPSAETASG